MRRTRKHIRLRNYDYASPGWYFVTICTKNRAYHFGEIRNKQMVYTPIGKQARLCWEEIPQHFPQVKLGVFVVMPNHVHGVLGISGAVACYSRTACDDSPVNPKNAYMAALSPKAGSLAAMIRSYKSAVTRWCKANGQGHFGWHVRFHDHIIRDKGEFDRIKNYIMRNVEKWEEDRFC
ncbi:transposase [Marinilabiliaceae bacterium JC017]|nr:transposase [Marinilabiliaceae bacterium JC017]